MNYIIYYRGPRIALREKVNDELITGLRIVDILLPIGRGQRQLILGDRGTGKTLIFLSIIIYNSRLNYLSTIDGLGSKRLFGFYIGLNQNLSKIYYLTILSIIDYRFNIIITTNSSSSAMLTFSLPLIGLSLCEILLDKGFDILICFDDLIKHAKSYRQLSLIIGKIPSRSAFPSDIFNIHSSLLERCARLNSSFLSGSISSFPIIETINSDITEYIATNLISITDGQLYLNKDLFNSSIRPSIDSSLSVSRIGSAAQSIIISSLSMNLKNIYSSFIYSLFSNSSLSISLIRVSFIYSYIYYHFNLFNIFYFNYYIFIKSSLLLSLSSSAAQSLLISGIIKLYYSISSFLLSSSSFSYLASINKDGMNSQKYYLLSQRMSFINLDYIFYQHYLFISSIESSIFILLLLNIINYFISSLLFLLSSSFYLKKWSLRWEKWFGLILIDWILWLPNRLLILTYLSSLSSPDLIIAFLHFSSSYLLLSLYFLTIARNNISLKFYYLLAAFIL